MNRGVWRTSATTFPGKRGRSAAVIDVKDVAVARRRNPSQEQTPKLLDQINALVAGVPVRLATGLNVLRSYMHLLSFQPSGLTFVRIEPEAADKSLREAAPRFHTFRRHRHWCRLR